MVIATTRTRAIDDATRARQRRVISNHGIDRRSFSRIPTVWKCQISCRCRSSRSTGFSQEGLRELLDEISPITRPSQEDGTDIPRSPLRSALGAPAEGRVSRSGRKIDPRVAEDYCRERDITYAAPLRVSARLVMKRDGRDQGNRTGRHLPRRLPDDDHRRHLHHQRRRARRRLPAGALAGRLFRARRRTPATGKLLATAKLIPNRGAWLEFETSNRDVISVKVDRKRKMPVTILLRAIGTRE